TMTSCLPITSPKLRPRAALWPLRRHSRPSKPTHYPRLILRQSSTTHLISTEPPFMNPDHPVLHRKRRNCQRRPRIKWRCRSLPHPPRASGTPFGESLYIPWNVSQLSCDPTELAELA